MNFKPPLQINQVITNNELHSIFSCGNMGGMRKSNTTNTLVLISDYTKSLYEDRWIGDVLHYTGMGKVGDQKLVRQNKILNDSITNQIDIFLFEVFLPSKYMFRGKVKLIDPAYQEEQKDDNGCMRKVWMFPIKLIETEALDDNCLKSNMEYKKNRIRTMSDEKLKEFALKTQKEIPSKRKVISTRIITSEYITEYIKRRANGICELCLLPAPFKDKEGRPYLEAYRLAKLSQNGSDTIANTVALCPNCRLKMQILNLPEDIERIQKNIKKIGF